MDRDDMEDFTDWLNDAANERACRILEKREPGSWAAKGFAIRRPSGKVPGRGQPSQPSPPRKKRPKRRKR